MQLGRFIRAITGHNNLLYHLHNMQADISPLCRFCLEQNEEFHHLATTCPPLWWERHHISAQETNSKWTPQQIINFTYIPRINEAFVKPLYLLDSQSSDRETGFGHSQMDRHDDPDIPMTQHSNTESESEDSYMDVSSLEPSSSESEYMSIVSVDSESEL